MSPRPVKIPIIFKDKQKRCLACGALLPPRKRKYCSQTCPQDLRQRLNVRTGLLCALNTRYATFYFSEHTIVMDLLPYGTKQVFSFMLPRTPAQKPVEDFCRMSNYLGNSWWAEKNRTHKWYRASQHVLEMALKLTVSQDTVAPLPQIIPNIKKESLVALKLKKTDLKSSHLKDVIRGAYRRQAKQHHPDLGGDSVMFHRLQEAYEKLIEWSGHPSYIVRRGFPDKWFYQGYTNSWVRPVSTNQ